MVTMKRLDIDFSKITTSQHPLSHQELASHYIESFILLVFLQITADSGRIVNKPGSIQETVIIY